MYIFLFHSPFPIISNITSLCVPSSTPSPLHPHEAMTTKMIKSIYHRFMNTHINMENSEKSTENE